MLFLITIFVFHTAIFGPAACFDNPQKPSERSLGDATPVFKNGNETIDVNALIEAVDIPHCILRCISSLRHELAQILSFNNTFDHIMKICQESETSQKCIHNGLCLSTNIFDSVVSGLRSLCEGPKQHFILKNEQCLRKALDATNLRCDAKCQLLREIRQFSHRPDLKGLGIAHAFDLLSHMGKICSASECFLPCFRAELNEACPRAGGVIMDGLLRPFYQLIAFIKKGGVGMQKIADDRLPKECKFLIEKASLDKIVNPHKS